MDENDKIIIQLQKDLEYLNKKVDGAILQSGINLQNSLNNLNDKIDIQHKHTVEKLDNLDTAINKFDTRLKEVEEEQIIFKSAARTSKWLIAMGIGVAGTVGAFVVDMIKTGLAVFAK